MPGYYALKLGYGLELRCAMDELDDTILVEVAWLGLIRAKRRFSNEQRHDTVKHEPEFLATQLAAVRVVIETGYADAGFPAA